MNPETGRLSQIGSVFYLKELKEVSEQTGDAVKFVCDHEVKVKFSKRFLRVRRNSFITLSIVWRACSHL